MGFDMLGHITTEAALPNDGAYLRGHLGSCVDRA